MSDDLAVPLTGDDDYEVGHDYRFAAEFARDLSHLRHATQELAPVVSNRDASKLPDLRGKIISLGQTLARTRDRSLPLALPEELSASLEKTVLFSFLIARDLSLLPITDYVADLAASLSNHTDELCRELAMCCALANTLAAQANQTVRPEIQISSHLIGERLVRLQVRLLPGEYRNRFLEELRAELHVLAVEKDSRRGQALYAIRQLSHILELRAALKAPRRRRFYWLHRSVCWLLISEWRIWGLLGPLMTFAIVNVFLKQGWGSTFFTIPAVVAFYAGVEWLRNRWDVEVKSRRRDRKGSSAK